MELGTLIRDARKEAGLTQAELGELLGFSSPHNTPSLSRWETGKMGMTLRNFEKLLEFLPIKGDWHTHGVWRDPDGVLHNLVMSGQTKEFKISYNPVSRLNRSEENERRKQVLKYYAQAAERIYEERTAGDFTWEGLLMSFFDEFA